MKRRIFAQVSETVCVACGACKKECPKAAIEIVKGCFAHVDTELCIGCGKCFRICPAGSIAMRERDDEDENEKNKTLA